MLNPFKKRKEENDKKKKGTGEKRKKSFPQGEEGVPQAQAGGRVAIWDAPKADRNHKSSCLARKK